MALATPMPRKFLSIIDNAQDTLRMIAQKSNSLIDELNTEDTNVRSSASTKLRDIETSAYRLALDLAEIEIASDCGNCPSAPPVTEADTRLIILASRLNTLVAYARAPNENDLNHNESIVAER